MSEHNSKFVIAVLLIVVLIGAYFLFPSSASTILPNGQPDSGIRVCYRNADGGETCELTKQLAIVNFEGRVYSSFHPFIKLASNIGSHTIVLNYRIDVHGNNTASKSVIAETIETRTPYQKELSVNADDVEAAMDGLNTQSATLTFSYIYGIKESKEIKSGSSSINNIRKLVVQAQTGIGGGTASTAPVSQTSPSTSDFQMDTCIIPYYYYSSSGIPRPCSRIMAITISPDKTVNVQTSVSVSNSPNTYGQAGGNIQLRVLNSQGDLMYAGQCLANFCYIAGSKDYPSYSASSGVLIGENRGYREPVIDTLSPRRIGGASEIIIFDKGTYSILLLEDGQQIAKKSFTVN